MIEYRSITKRDVAQWQVEPATVDSSRGTADRIPRSGLQRGAESLASFGCAQDLEPDAVRAIAAFDDERLVGRLHVVYTDLLVGGRRLLRCAVGEDFFVLDEYRDRAVGLTLMMKALKLGMPFIEAGVSGPMRKILDSWKQFVLVDGSQMFQVALDRKGIVQAAKWDFYEQETSASAWPERAAKVSLLYRGWRQRRSLGRAARGKPQLRPAGGLTGDLECFLGESTAGVQLPWNRALLDRALAGSDPNRGAWVVESANGRTGPWLVTMYRQERVLGRGPNGRVRSLREAHLNEIYPPVADRDTGAALLAFGVERAAAMGASILQIHALVPAIEEACRARGLGSRMTKSIYVAVDGVDPATRALLVDPQNWRCRAFNENQFEEAFTGTGADAAGVLV